MNGVLLLKHKQMHGEEQRRKLHYPTVRRLTDRYPKHKTEPQESSKFPGGQGPSANLSSPIPVPGSGSDHGRLPREGGGAGGGERPPRLMVVMPTASSYVPFHITQALVNVAGRC